MFLVIQTAFLGDMILTTPLLERLSERGAVDVIATPANAALLANHPAVRDVIVFDKRGTHRGASGMRAMVAQIRFRTVNGQRVRRGAQVAYMAQGSLRSAAIARLAGVPAIVGFASSAGRWLYTERVTHEPTLHHAARLLMLAGLFAPAEGVPRPALYPAADEEDAVRALLQDAGLEPGAPLVVLAPGSVWATKRWPGYDRLAVLLGGAPREARVVITGARGDAGLVPGIATALREAGMAAPIDATGRLTLLGTAALMRHAQVVVTNDSAPLHLASAMNVPTVALFGPTVPAFGFGPLAERRAVVQHETLPCRPCDAHGPMVCPLGHWRCMQEVGAERVMRAVDQVRTGIARLPEQP